MIVELLYTSAPQGLKQGSRGFCTVLSTEGLPINLAQRLEALSAYRHIYPPNDPRTNNNPVCYSHLKFTLGGRAVSVLSRISAYGFDYSHRSNKLAHHVVFDDVKSLTCGPGAVSLQPGLLRSEWDGQCRTLHASPNVRDEAEPARPCETWKRITGDAGWAGVVASAWLKPATKSTWIIFSEAQSALLPAMMREAIALLPEKKRWSATYSTYCTNIPPDVDCRIRCVFAGSDEARMAIARGTVIDLTKRLAAAPDSPETIAAREGKVIGGDAPKPIAQRSTAQTLEAPDTDDIESPAAEDLDEEYELAEENLVAVPKVGPPAVPGVRPPGSGARGPGPIPPPRATVPPKHMKEYRPPAAPVTNSKGPLLFVSVAAGIVLAAVLGAAAIMLMRPKPTEVAQNETGTANVETSGTQADPARDTINMPATPLPNPGLPFGPDKSDEIQPVKPVVPPSENRFTLRCDPPTLKIGEHDLNSTKLGDLMLTGGKLDASQVDITQNGIKASGLFVNEMGQVMWNGSPPPQSGEMAVLKYDISYKLGNEVLKTTFELTVENQPDGNLKLAISNAQDPNWQLSHLCPGSVLTASLEGSDSDEAGKPEERIWKWQASAGTEWQPLESDKPTYTVKASEAGKKIRATVSYRTTRSKDKPETLTSADYQVVAPSIVNMSLDEIIWAKPNLDLATTETIPVTIAVQAPQLKDKKSQTVSYTEKGQSVKDGKLKTTLNQLAPEKDVQSLSEQLKAIREKNRAYMQAAELIDSELSKHPALIESKKKLKREYRNLSDRVQLIPLVASEDQVIDYLVQVHSTLNFKLQIPLKDWQKDADDLVKGFAKRIPNASTKIDAAPVLPDKLQVIIDLVKTLPSKPPAWNNYLTAEKQFWEEVRKVVGEIELRTESKDIFKASEATSDPFAKKVPVKFTLPIQFRVETSDAVTKWLTETAPKKP